MLNLKHSVSSIYEDFGMMLVSGYIAIQLFILTRVRTNYANGKDERPCVHYSLNLLL